MKLRKELISTGLPHTGYRALTSLAAPLAAPLLLLSPRGRLRIGERYGAWGEIGSVQWWFHGASVGEVQGLLPLMRRARELQPDAKILLSATSPTGLERGAHVADFVRLAPLDAPWCVRRALRSVQPVRFVGCETELWPALLHELKQRGVRCDLVNGRISDYTLGRYRRFSALFTPLIKGMERICVASEEQAQRFLALGAAPTSVTVTGHTKYDSIPAVTSTAQVEEIRRSFFPGADESPVIVLGSVRPGEEGGWIREFEKVSASGSHLKMIIAPRHAEKFDYFADVLTRSARNWVRWSSGSTAPRDILLLDVMGQLERAYSIAQLAFVGATLVDVGGHNPLEPAMYSVPVCAGPHVTNIRDVVDDMSALGGIVRISNEEEIGAILKRVATGDEALRQAGEQGRIVWKRHTGSAKRVMSILSGTAV